MRPDQQPIDFSGFLFACGICTRSSFAALQIGFRLHRRGRRCVRLAGLGLRSPRHASSAMDADRAGHGCCGFLVSLWKEHVGRPASFIFDCQHCERPGQGTRTSAHHTFRKNLWGILKNTAKRR
jgi:hypothetical protein